MVLATHAIIGGAIGRVLPGQPIVALVLGFVSHFFLDAVPHWDYRLESLAADQADPLNTHIRLNRSFGRDLIKLGLDTLIGLVVAWLLFGDSGAALISVFAGALGALLPDVFHFVYFRLQREPFRSLERFHLWIHSKNERLMGRPALGIFLQTALVLAVVVAVNTLLGSHLNNLLPNLIAAIRPTDLIDIIIVAVGIYFILLFIKETKSFLIANTALLLAGLYYAAEHFNLSLIRQLFQPLLAFVVVIFAIVFQRELRRFFEWFASPAARARRGPLAADAVETIVRAVKIMSEKKIGAIIVIPREHPLDSILEGGYVLDGRLSTPLLLSIFDTSSPGHDGAVLIREGRVKKFGLHLPLAEHFDRTLGTRHRAALGLAERTDALVIVVSEERGTVSLAVGGTLRPLATVKELETALGLSLQAESGDAFDYFLLRNFWWKISALVLALVLWFVFVFQTGVVRRDLAAPVAFRFVPAGYTVTNLNTDKITFTVAGSQGDLPSFEAANLAASFDLSGAAPGYGQLPVTAAAFNLPSYLQITNIEPGNIRFTLVPTKAKP